MQAQDYAGAKWAVAQRTIGLTDADLDRALADGSILRTHVLRPTWHFVTPADIRWLLALTAPRVNADGGLSISAAGVGRGHVQTQRESVEQSAARQTTHALNWKRY